MNQRNVVLITALAALLFGCAGIGVKNSSDPHRKISYAYGAMNQGRFVPAHRLINEAIAIYKKTNNKSGLANAYHAYGVFHKMDPKEFNIRTIGATHDLKKSMKYYKMAIELYEEVGDNNGAAKSNFGFANAVGEIDNKKSCKHYDIAIKKYDPNGSKHSINPNFKDFPSMVKAFKEEFCKKNV